MGESDAGIDRTEMPEFEQRLRRLWPPEAWCDVTVVAAVSGGADSVALARGLAAVRAGGPGRLLLAHLNHGLRGAASDADERFVRELADRMQVPCHVGRCQRDEAFAGKASEEWARDQRYCFLRNLAMQEGARYVVTAHTADDQAETVLHRVLRGTGLAGLAGMRRTRPLVDGITLIRPLLGVGRAELTQYLEQIRQPYCHDASNDALDFTRNRLRRQLLPQLAADYNPQVVEALTRLAQLAGEAQDVIAALVAETLSRAMRIEPDRVVLDCRLLAGEPRYLLREMCLAAWRRQGWSEQPMGFAEWDGLADDIAAALPSGQRRKRVLPGKIMAERSGDHLTLVAPR